MGYGVNEVSLGQVFSVYLASPANSHSTKCYISLVHRPRFRTEVQRAQSHPTLRLVNSLGCLIYLRECSATHYNEKFEGSLRNFGHGSEEINYNCPWCESKSGSLIYSYSSYLGITNNNAISYLLMCYSTA
jgi:hypothetical protein